MTDEEKNLNDIKKAIQQNVNDYINSIDCCSLCQNKGKKDRYEEICLSCCFYYPSHFEVKE